jgi:hypothetical protein
MARANEGDKQKLHVQCAELTAEIEMLSSKLAVSFATFLRTLSPRTLQQACVYFRTFFTLF